MEVLDAILLPSLPTYKAPEFPSDTRRTICMGASNDSSDSDLSGDYDSENGTDGITQYEGLSTACTI